ncbi:hypothetical protein F5880DRAFT_1569076 [Lentinula raphanica]|nr:hypothetical protein F5880DRAFT_1569076 [Lentinula raphanica]
MSRDGSITLIDDLLAANDPNESERKRKLVAGDTKPSSDSGIDHLSPRSDETHYSKRIRLHVDIPPSKSIATYSVSDSQNYTELEESESEPSSSLSPDSLFDEALSFPASLSESEGQAPLSQPQRGSVALRNAPPIPGLFFDPSMKISEELGEELREYCMKQYFDAGEGKGRINQIMLFERAPSDNTEPAYLPSTGLPPPLIALLDKLSDLLRPPALPLQIHDLLFPTANNPTFQATASEAGKPSILHNEKPKQARQAILNLYAPGEGISPHVDLLRRFGDGIIGVSLRGGCVMRFERVHEEQEGSSQRDTFTYHSSSSSSDPSSGSESHELYLLPNSIIVLSGDARYKWTHGIEKRLGDWVERGSGSSDHGGISDEATLAGAGGKPVDAEWIPRDTRLSITFRWLLPGADVVGYDDSESG